MLLLVEIAVVICVRIWWRVTFLSLMQNPWFALPETAPFVLPIDTGAVEAYSTHFSDRSNLKLQTQLIPEPYHGSPKAQVCILSLNPGFSEHDRSWHIDSELGQALRKNLTHKPADYPFVFLNPRLIESPGGRWWRRKLRRVIDQIGLKKTSSTFFNVELFPYHSKNFKRVPAKLSPNRLVPSSEYSAHLVRQFINKNKTIVVFRSKLQWTDLVPELENYQHMMVVKSPRNPTISEGNLDNFETLMEEITR